MLVRQKLVSSCQPGIIIRLIVCLPDRYTVLPRKLSHWWMTVVLIRLLFLRLELDLCRLHFLKLDNRQQYWVRLTEHNFLPLPIIIWDMVNNYYNSEKLTKSNPISILGLKDVQWWSNGIASLSSVTPFSVLPIKTPFTCLCGYFAAWNATLAYAFSVML